ncbi:MAG: IclR family transcriptional regulator [Rhodospirillales bacterium]
MTSNRERDQRALISKLETSVNDSTPPDAGKDRAFVNGLARGLKVLASFSPDSNRMSLGDLAQATGLPKSTVARLVHTLVEVGYVYVCPDSGRYRIHPRVLTLGYPVMATMDKRLVALPMMQELADYSRGTVSLGIRDGLSMILIERSRDRTVRALPLDIGSRIPMETTSMGQAYFASASPAEKTDILEQFKTHDPDRFKEVERKLRAAEREYAEKGYCTAVGTWEDDVNAVGVAVELSNEAMAAFNCGGPSSRIAEQSLPDLGIRLAELARHFQTADWVGQLPPRPYRGVETS